MTKLAESLKKMPSFIHCWPKGELPERFHYGHNARVPDWLCLPDPGARIMDGNPEHPDDGGDHGYDPASPDMRALFWPPARRSPRHTPARVRQCCHRAAFAPLDRIGRARIATGR
jgi:hypothetical protein